MGQILAAGREHDPDFLERARFRPLALGGEAVIGTAYDLFHRYVLFTSKRMSLAITLPFSAACIRRDFNSLLTFSFIIIRFIVYKFCHVYMAIVSCPAAFGAISLSAF